MTDNSKVPDDEFLDKRTIGEQLKEKRESLTLTLKQIAQELNLSVNTIQALEDDCYAILPGSTFTKGYLRAYSRLLGINIDHKMNLIDIEIEKVTDMSIPKAILYKKGRILLPKSNKRRRDSKKKWIILMLIITMVILWKIQSETDNKDFEHAFNKLKSLFGQNDSQQINTQIKEADTDRILQNREDPIRIE